MTDPHSLFPPNPADIGKYIAAGFEMGIGFAKALSDVIFEFISSLGVFIA